MTPMSKELEQELREYGFQSAQEIDDLFGGYPVNGFSTDPDTTDRFLLSHCGGAVYTAINQWVGLGTPVSLVISAVIQRFGWTKEAWVRIHQWHIAGVYPALYATVHKHYPVDITKFEMDCYVADDVTEIMETEY